MVIGSKRSLFALLAVMWILLPRLASAGAVGTLTAIEGKVDILRPGTTQVVPAHSGDQVFSGDVVRTKRNGKAEIRFADDSVVQLAPESRMRIDDYTIGPAKVRESGLLSLFRGKIRALVSKAKGGSLPVSTGGTASNFNIRTRTAIAGVKGTGLIVFYERGVSGVIFTEGHGFVYNPAVPDRVVPMSRGQVTFVVSSGNAPMEPRPVSATVMAAQLQQMTVSNSGSSSNGSGESGGQPQSPSESHPQSGSGTITVVSENPSMTGFAVDTGGASASAATAPVVLTTVSVVPTENNTTLVPITETQPNLIATPVTVRATIPK